VVYVSAQLPADAFSAVEIQDHREIDVLVQQLYVCDIRDPGPVQPGYLCVLQNVWIYWKSMTGISRYRLESLLQAQKVILSHHVQHAFVVNDIASVSEFCCHPPVTVDRKFQSDLLNLVLQIHISSWDLFRLYPPFVVAAATYFKCLA
jgi:hypothetical protein